MWWLELRRSPALLALVTMAIAGIGMLQIRLPIAVGVPSALGSAISVAVIVMGPLAGGFCAYAVSARVSAYDGQRRHSWARPDAAVRLATLLPIGAATAFAYLGVATFATIRSVVATGVWPWPSYVLLGLGVLFTDAAIGAIAAMILPNPRATPIVVVVGLLLLNRALPIPLSGPVSLTLDPRVVAVYLLAAALAWTLAIFAPISAATGRRNPPVRRPLAIGLTVVALVGVLSATAVAGTSAQQLRDPTGQYTCDRGVCVWNDHAAHLPTLVAARARLATLTAHGFAAPPAFAEEGLPQPEDLYVLNGSGMPGFRLPPDWMVIYGMALEVETRTVGNACMPNDREQAHQHTIASYELTEWLTRLAADGPQPADVHGGPPIDTAAIDALRTRPMAEQLAWAHTRLRTLTSSPCR